MLSTVFSGFSSAWEVAYSVLATNLLVRLVAFGIFYSGPTTALEQLMGLANIIRVVRDLRNAESLALLLT
jgi:hypothetical protein